MGDRPEGEDCLCAEASTAANVWAVTDEGALYYEEASSLLGGPLLHLCAKKNGHGACCRLCALETEVYGRNL